MPNINQQKYLENFREFFFALWKSPNIIKNDATNTKRRSQWQGKQIKASERTNTKESETMSSQFILLCGEKWLWVQTGTHNHQCAYAFCLMLFLLCKRTKLSGTKSQRVVYLGEKVHFLFFFLSSFRVTLLVDTDAAFFVLFHDNHIQQKSCRSDLCLCVWIFTIHLFHCIDGNAVSFAFDFCFSLSDFLFSFTNYCTFCIVFISCSLLFFEVLMCKWFMCH